MVCRDCKVIKNTDNGILFQQSEGIGEYIFTRTKLKLAIGLITDIEIEIHSFKYNDFYITNIRLIDVLNKN